jgi:hypothetical protein
MNIGQVKIFSWSAAGLLTACLGLYVFFFWRDLETKRRLPDAAKVQAVLEAVEPVQAKAADLVAYEDVRRLYLPSCEKCKGDPNCRHLNWTGKPPPPPPSTTGPAVDEKPPRVTAADLVKILMVKVDTTDAAQSAVYLKYRSKAAVLNTGTGGVIPPLHEGDHLAAPHQGVRLASITAQGVVFAFDEEGREDETVSPDEFALGTTIVQVMEEGGLMLPAIGAIPRASAAPWRPTKTTAFGQNRWMLGTDDVAYANDNYAKILADDVRTARHQDPRTGKYDGVELKAVTPGSFAERHGAQEGDVVKSINGHPVTSVQEAISYAKMNANQFTTWEIVVERNGRLQTFYYHSPQQ